uniref:Uncharacterized protein n=1 Tax=Rhizophora mucronata TaxID=61149 RepID=A0A2P2KBZ5_RHIMU
MYGNWQGYKEEMTSQTALHKQNYAICTCNIDEFKYAC